MNEWTFTTSSNAGFGGFQVQINQQLAQVNDQVAQFHSQLQALQAMKAVDGPDDEGSAGVREPRRPLPFRPTDSMAMELTYA